MTHSSSSPYNTPRQNKPPDPNTNTGLSKSSLNSSSTLSLSPSASVLLSSSSRPSRNSNSNRSSKTPIIPSTSSLSSSTRNTKLEQIIQNFYTKTAQIIIQSRISNERLKGVSSSSSTAGGRRKINKWFNISTHDCELLKEDLKFWKSYIKSGQEDQSPPLVIDIYLETTEPELLRQENKLNLVGVQRRILIESWALTLNHPLPDFPVDLPNLYKRSIVFFRSLHSLVRLLPSHNLYRRFCVHDNCGSEISLGYRLSTNGQTQPDEVPLDRPLSHMDTTQLYEFKDVVTPLGTFKLKLLYREHCQFDTATIREDTSSVLLLPGGIDVDENYFTPTMTKYRQKRNKEITTTKSNSAVMHSSTSTSSTTNAARSRINSYRSINTNRYPAASISSTTTSNKNNNTLERRISAPLVQPFKSPSLSSSPQAELMFTSSRSQTPERQLIIQQQRLVESGGGSSSSFGRKIEFSSSFEKFKSTNSSNTSLNRAASLNMIATPDMMMRRWSRTSDHSSINLESEEDEEDLEDFMKFITARQELKLFEKQQQQSTVFATPAPQQQQVMKDSEDSKSLTHFRNIQEAHNILSDSMSFSIHPTQSKEPASSSLESTSSSLLNKGLNLPAIPSPLHNTESVPIIKPSSSSPSFHRRHQSSTTGPQPPQQREEFFSYPRGQPHQLTAHQAEIVAQSPLKNRQAPPPPPPPSAPVRRISASTGLNDDDDSLVFKMSELSAVAYDEEEQDYIRRLKRLDNMRRINSSGNIPTTQTSIHNEGDHYYSDDGTSGIAKKHHIHRLYFDDL